jgi:phosphoribosylaminoimidazole-succinocarboxamide synthase
VPGKSARLSLDPGLGFAYLGVATASLKEVARILGHLAMVDATALADFADNVLENVEIPELPNHYRGKVRDNYDLPDGRRIIVASDRLSAFDIILAAIPLKGQVLTQTARFWFEATRDICPNHVIEYPDPNVVICRRLEILPVEIVVRDYLAGTTGTSILSLYRSGQREMYGVRLPDGLKPNQKLPETVITPTSKAFHGGHDEPLTPADIVGRNLLTQAQWRSVCDYALSLFARGREMARERGLILVDTKYEFGIDDSGQVILADEIHTPDSSRYWFRESYRERFEAGEKPESFDKDFVRNWVASRCDPYKEPVPDIPREVILETAAVYIRAYETITGQAFALPDPGTPVLDRIRANLAPYF